MIDTLIACTKCGKDKPPTDYYRKPNGGFWGVCKHCTVVYQPTSQADRTVHLEAPRRPDQVRVKAAPAAPRPTAQFQPQEWAPEARDVAFWEGARPAPIPDDPPFGVTPRMCYQRGHLLYLELD